jgi:GT2 family glycosyltransferase
LRSDQHPPIVAVEPNAMFVLVSTETGLINSPEITVVIAVHNSAATLAGCLEALSKSTLQPLECVVVDDASSDGAKAVAERHGARVISLSQRQGPAHARNLGALHARGDVILFLDADVRIHNDAISCILAHFRSDTSLAAVMGAYDDSPAAAPFVSQYRNLLHCFTHRAGRREASTFWTACGAIRKEVFLSSGGLDERFGRPAIEDLEFGARLKADGGRILLDSAIQVQHLKCWTLTRMIKTDVFDRGIPWTLLILGTGSMPDDLNLRWSQRLSVALAFLSVAALPFGAVKIALGCMLALACLNWRFYAFLARRRGMLFALRAVPLHFLFHFYSGIAFLAGAALHLLNAVKPSASKVAGEEAP